jgi:hypothetical protein
MNNLGWYVFVAVVWTASKLCDAANAFGYPCALNTTHPMEGPGGNVATAGLPSPR